MLPNLPETLKILDCNNNQLTYLPEISNKLQIINCSENNLSCLPNLYDGIFILDISKNPIYDVIYNLRYNFKLRSPIINSNINPYIIILNRFRELYYCIKFKNKFRKWLWEKVREPNAMKLYNPEYLLNELKDEETDLDKVLNAW